MERIASGHTVLLDAKWHEKLRTKSMWVTTMKSGNHTYLRVKTKEPGIKAKERILARVIMNATKGMDVDHIDGNTLNNQTANLRLCTHRDNMRNQRSKCNKLGIGTIGVSKTASGRYGASFRGEYIGSWNTIDEAQAAHDCMSEIVNGDFAPK